MNRGLAVTIIMLGIMIITWCCSFSTPKKDINMDKIEIINTCEDMIEWIQYDVEEGKVDSTIGATYITNMQQVINHAERLK